MLTIVECNVGISNILESNYLCAFGEKKIYETQSMMTNLINLLPVKIKLIVNLKISNESQSTYSRNKSTFSSCLHVLIVS